MHRYYRFHPPSGTFVETCSAAHLCIALKPRPHCLRGQAQRVTVHINEYGVSSDITYRVASGNERQRLGENFILLPYPHKQHRHVKGIGTVHTYHRPFCTGIFCDHFLKTVYEFSDTRYKRRINTFVQIFLLIPDKTGCMQRNYTFRLMKSLTDKINNPTIHCKYQPYISSNSPYPKTSLSFPAILLQ